MSFSVIGCVLCTVCIGNIFTQLVSINIHQLIITLFHFLLVFLTFIIRYDDFENTHKRMKVHYLNLTLVTIPTRMMMTMNTSKMKITCPQS